VAANNHDDRKVVYTVKTVRFFLATIAFALITALLAVLITFAAYRDQHNQLVNLSEQSNCRAKVSADAIAAAERGLTVLLDSIVALGNRQPLDFDAMAKAAANLDKAASAGEAITQTCSASNVSEGGNK
jgi:hypothetical protein